ncbi:hypothetical protein ES705_14647 [subsurface metagenome]
MGSHNKAATEVATHSALDTGVHGVGASTVCSETEAATIAAAAAKKIATGSYTGSGAARQVTTGFKCSLVIIETATGEWATQAAWVIPNMSMSARAAAIDNASTHSWLHATDGFGLSDNLMLNKNGVTYYYWAISE